MEISLTERLEILGNLIASRKKLQAQLQSVNGLIIAQQKPIAEQWPEGGTPIVYKNRVFTLPEEWWEMGGEFIDAVPVTTLT